MFCKRKKKGFSLIEIITAIAVMAVFVMLLVPSLLNHNERSRAHKDIDSGDKLTSSVIAAITNEDAYSEILEDGIYNNVSCYIDNTAETGLIKIPTKGDSNAHYTFDESCRTADLTPYSLGGNMRGVTITFEPIRNGTKTIYSLKEGIINKYTSNEGKRLFEYINLYGELKQVLDDQIDISSQTYKNSEFTIFISFGSGITSGNVASGTKVYGQFGGTNLEANATHLVTTDRVLYKPGEDSSALGGSGSGTEGDETFTPNENSKPKKIYVLYIEDEQLLTFVKSETELIAGDSYNGKTITRVYQGVTEYIGGSDETVGTTVPWSELANVVERIVIADQMMPSSTAGWFKGFNKLTDVNLSKLNTINTTSMAEMFMDCTSLTELNVSHFNTSNVKDMTRMFAASNKNTPMRLTSLDVSRFKMKNVELASGMFAYCTSLVNPDVSKWNTTNIKDMSSMFRRCLGITKLDVSNWDTGSCTDMSRMFDGCMNIEALDVSNWNTSNVTNMRALFQLEISGNKGRAKVTELDVSKWDTSNVTEMGYMFFGCGNITELDVSNWNTSKNTDFNHMFADNYKLKSLDMSGWDTSNVITFNGMFNDCWSLKTLDVSSFDLSSAKSVSQMFEAAKGLEQIIGLNKWDTSGVHAFGEMFQYCDSLKELDLSSFDTTNANKTYTYSSDSKGMNNWLFNIASMEKIIIGPKVSWTGDGTCTGGYPQAKISGYWYDVETGNKYTSSTTPDKVQATYVAKNPN